MGTGGPAPHGLDALTAHSLPMEGLLPGRVRVPDGGWQVCVSCPGVHRVRCAFGVGQQSVRGLPCFAVGDEHISGGDGVVEVRMRQGVCDSHSRAFLIFPVVF